MTRRPENSPNPYGTSPNASGTSPTPSGTSPNPSGAASERGVLDEALEPEQIRSLNSALRGLSHNDRVGTGLQDAAKKLLSGRLPLRDALNDPAVARALGGGMASLRGQWESLSEEERDQVRHGEPLTDESRPADPSEPRRAAPDEQPSRFGKKNPGRHSGGFSLY
ncbi:hypothetical protein ABZT17_30745 [Streptomyces sp. NPDC005648]|uniref:hypothetical protein n=1 Tax=Streptomyces sp. NPDC005648 TaxID=3157044 RepID=UPI0033A32959